MEGMVIGVGYTFLLIIIFSESDAMIPIDRIVDWLDAEPEKYHNIVRLEMRIERLSAVAEIRHKCTGAALKPTWVLTAAHCIFNTCPEIKRAYPNVDCKYYVRYDSSMSIPGTNDSFSDIIAMISHPSYKLFNGDSRFVHSKNDIALFKTTPINLKHYRKLSALDYSSTLGHEIIAVGFSITRSGEVFRSGSAHQKSLKVMSVVSAQCPARIKKIFYPMLCLYRRCADSASLCPGDSGGPLLHRSGAVGVISWSYIAGCYSKTKTQLYDAFATPISPYIGWILKHINKS